jgi:biotin/methionine sulfoxide reductase
VVRKTYLERGPGAATDKRGAEPFVEVSWQEALDLVAAELQRVRHAFGNASIFAGSYGWSSAGRFHHAQSQVHRFMNAIGGYCSHLGTYSLGAARTLMPRIVMPMDDLFVQLTSWPSIEKHCELFVGFGGIPIKNAQIGVGGASQHWLRQGLQRLAASGCTLVNVGPASEDLDCVDGGEWIPIRPNTDTAVMLELAHTLLAEGPHDRAFLDRCCFGFDRFSRYLLGETDGQVKHAGWAAKIAGTDADKIVRLARWMAASRTMINASWSLQRADHGEQPYWMLVALAAMLGQTGLPGGGFGMGYGAINNGGAHAAAFSGPVLPQGSNPVHSAIPVARISDMLLHSGAEYQFDGGTHAYPDIRLIYWAGGNPFRHHQDLNRLVAAWRRPETIVVNEQYWNANAKMADVVLLATTMLERNDIGSASRDRYMIAMKQAIAPVGEARDDYAIFSELSARLGSQPAYTEGRDTMQWLRHLYQVAQVRARAFDIELPGFGEFWAAGYLEMAVPATEAVLLRAFRDDPDAHPLKTPSGKIEIYSQTIASFSYDDCPGHPVWFEPAEWLGGAAARRYPLHLISNQPVTKLHSQYDHGTVSLANKVRGREPIALHPEDARARGIAAGDVVRVFNDCGACLAGARLVAGLMRGVAQMATGAWYDPLQPGELGTLDKHGNANVLTLDKGTSRLTQACSAQTALVEVELYPGAPPPITAYDPPPFATDSAARAK